MAEPESTTAIMLDQAEVDAGRIPGVVVAIGRGGKLVWHEAVGFRHRDSRAPMQRDTIFRIASMTKPVVAAAAMILVEECRLRLDEPVDPLLPELADRRVLRAMDSPLDDTAPAKRPISLRDLLTLRLGIGAVLAPPETYKIQQAMAEAEAALGETR